VVDPAVTGATPPPAAGAGGPALPDPLPRRLNLGCGWDRRAGYLNVDFMAFHDPDLVADVRLLPMLPDGWFEEVVAQDVLEHLPRADALPALQEWARLLQPGGRLVLRVPDLIGLLGLFLRDHDARTHGELLVLVYGTQAYDGDFHHNSYTEPVLRQQLHDTGFTRVQVERRDEWLFDVVAERAAPGEAPQWIPPSQMRFLAPGEPGEPVGAGPEVRAAIADASAAAGVDDLPPDALRFAGAKRAVLRVGRLFLARQARFNRSVVDALEGLDRRTGGLR
jgi:SAM-dependent methyltransferase